MVENGCKCVKYEVGEKRGWINGEKWRLTRHTCTNTETTRSVSLLQWKAYSQVGRGVKIKLLFQYMDTFIHFPLWTITKAFYTLVRCTARWVLVVVLLSLLGSVTSFGGFQFLSTKHQWD